MSKHDLSCVIIQQNTGQQQTLLRAVRAYHSGIQVGLANGSIALKSLLVRSPMLLFYTVPAKQAVAIRYERRLLQLLQRFAPDCILVRMTERAWLGVAEVKPVNGSAVQSGEICTIATVNKTILKQQLDYLFAYAQLKVKFRQCKHLLSIAELRSQWLVDYAREAVAYVAADQHLHVNIAYLSLFGLNAVSDARAMRVLNLVQPEERAVFTAVKRAAEQGTKPSNKLLLTLQTAQGRHFRAEIRCMPAVYQGRRCVQLHVHPLLSSEQQAVETQSEKTETAEKKSPNPWKEPSESARQLQQQTEKLMHQTQDTGLIPTELGSDVIRQLQPAFKELLNLRGKDYPALLWAQPWLQYGNTGNDDLSGNRHEKTPSQSTEVCGCNNNIIELDYAQLLDNAHDQSARFQLDYWNLQAALKFLAQQKDAPVLQQVVVSLGRWALTNTKQVAQLLKLLKKQPVLNQQLVLGLDSAVSLRCQKNARFLLPLYRASGVKLMFERVHAVDENLWALLELSGNQLIQLHGSYAQNITTKADIPEALSVLLAQMSERNVSTVLSGIQDINALSLLCETPATYLQGPILDRFSR